MTSDKQFVAVSLSQMLRGNGRLPGALIMKRQGEWAPCLQLQQ